MLSAPPTANGTANAPTAKAATMPCLNIGIAGHFCFRAGMGDGACPRRSNLVRIFPQRSALKRSRLRTPLFRAAVELGLGQFDVESPLLGIEHDHVAVADKPDRTADGSLGPNMAYAKAARCT